MADAAPALSSDEQRIRYDRWKSCADLIYPNGARSSAELQHEIQESRDPREFLQSLKRAWETGLLLQPAFFDEAVLLKFFAGSAVTWKVSPAFYTHSDVLITAELQSSVFPGMTVTVESRCWRQNTAAGSGTDSSAHLVGSFSIAGRPIPEFTVHVIRGVLGRETRQEIDQMVIDVSGGVHGPTGIGTVVYTDPIRDESAPGLRVGISFFVPFQNSYVNPNEISDGDWVDSIYLTEKTHRRLSP